VSPVPSMGVEITRQYTVIACGFQISIKVICYHHLVIKVLLKLSEGGRVIARLDHRC
jgi:transcriptional antiterminator Rof (Rho-off)